MRKGPFIFLFLFIFVLSACGVPSQANLDSPEKENEMKEIHQLVVDNEHVKITVLNMKKEKSRKNTTVTVTFDILNKRNDTIKIRAQRLSVDDRMADEQIYQLEEEITPKHAATAELVIQQINEKEFPKFKNDLELELCIISLDDPTYRETHPVKIIHS